MHRQLIVVFCVLLCASFPTTKVSAEPPAKKIALLVGVSDYSDKSFDDLNYADNDAGLTAVHLEVMGFETTVLTNEQATKEKVDLQLDSFLQKAEQLESDSIVFILFSGHGQQLKTSETNANGIARVEETPFFCPHDAKATDRVGPQLRGKSAKEIAQQMNLVSLNSVLEKLDERSNSLNNLIVVDACRNNPAKGKTPGITGSTARGIPNGVSLLFAARSGQRSWESTDPKIPNGVFTHYLLQALRGEAKNRRGLITWSGLTAYISDEVSYEGWKIAGDKNRVQHAQAVINSDGVVILGEPVDENAILLRLYDLVGQPERLLAMANRLPDPKLAKWPVFWSMLMHNGDRSVDRTTDAIKYFQDHVTDNDLASMLSQANLMGASAEQLRARKLSDDLIPSAFASHVSPTVSVVDDTLLEPISGFLDHLSTASPSKLVRLAATARLIELKRTRTVETALRSEVDAKQQLQTLQKEVELLQRDLSNMTTAAETKGSSVLAIVESISKLAAQQADAIKQLSLVDESEVHPLVGTKYPDIEGIDLFGDPLKLSQFRGKVLIIDVWAYW